MQNTTGEPQNRNGKFRAPFLFFLALMLLYGFVGVFDVLPQRPVATHMFAQADRASVALNYYEENMNFFKPTLHNRENETGRTGLEFPLVNYLAALCYQAFGFNELYYRLIVLLLATFGFIAAYFLAFSFLKNPWWAGLITLTWAASPVMLYYAPNFIASSASMSFMMGGWWLFLCRPASKMHLTAFFLLITLAGLTTISSGIGLIAMLILVMLKLLFPSMTGPFLERIPANKSVLAAIIAGMALTATWYGYAYYLKQFYESGHFLMNIMPPTSLSDALQTIKMFLGMWLFDIYPWFIWLLMAGSGGIVLWFYRTTHQSLLAVTLLLAAGNTGFFLLMLEQFRVHDYYLLPLMPVFFFLLLTAASALQKHMNQTPHPGIYNIAVPVVLCVLLIPAWIHAKNVQSHRYETEGHEQLGTNYKPYLTLERVLEKHGISRDDYVISFVDNSFNISLYFMNRKGDTFWDDAPQFDILFRIYQRGNYIIANDTNFIDHPSVVHFMETPVLTHEHIRVYPISLSKSQRKQFLDSTLAVLEPVRAPIHQGAEYRKRVRKFTEHFHLSPLEAEAKAAFGTYKWILNSRVRPVLQASFPEHITEGSDPLEMHRFYRKHKDAILNLHEAGKLSEHELNVLQCPLPEVLYRYKPEQSD